MRRRLLRAILAVTAALALAGCANIPDSGPVGDGGHLSSGAKGFEAFNYIPSDPAPGAGQEEILRGFIRAALNPQDQYAVARKFLTPELAAKWNPEAAVTIDTGTDRDFLQQNDHTWQLGLTPVAFVNATGGYRQAESDTAIRQSYDFAKVGGQWRIAKAPDGTVIDEISFGNVFSPHTLYFFDPGYRYLVPDERWFLTRESTTTRITNALLAGPSKWLSGAVATAFPQGTRLSVDSVTVTGTTAHVDLNGVANSANSLALQRMKLQLRMSLSSAGTVNRIAISVEGAQKTVPSLTGATPVQDPGVDARPLVMREGEFGFATGDQVATIPVLSNLMDRLTPLAVTLSGDHKTSAVQTDAGVDVLRADGRTVTLIDSRPGLIAPSIDPYGFVWTVPGGEASAVLVTGRDGGSAPVATDWQHTSSRILALQVSREGTRAAALLEAGGTVRLVVAGVERDGSGVPTKLSEPIVLTTVPQGVTTSMAWLDELDLLVAVTDAHDSSTIVRQPVGGPSVRSSGPNGTVAVASGNGVPPYWVLTEAGAVQASRESGWQQSTTKVSVLGTQTGLP